MITCSLTTRYRLSPEACNRVARTRTRRTGQPEGGSCKPASLWTTPREPVRSRGEESTERGNGNETEVGRRYGKYPCPWQFLIERNCNGNSDQNPQVRQARPHGPAGPVAG